MAEAQLSDMLSLRGAWETLYRPFIEPVCDPQTVLSYEATVKAWERWAPYVALRQSRSLHFSLFSAAALEAGRSPATVNRYLREIRVIVRFLVAEGVVDRMPTIRSVTEPEVSKWRPTTEQVGQIYAAIRESPLNWPDGPEGFAADWWEAFVCWSFVGALRASEAAGIREKHVTGDGIEIHAPKTERLSFVPSMPATQARIDTMRRWWQRGVEVQSWKCREFYRAVDAIGVSVGFEWRPHDLKRASVDAWSDVSETAAVIVGHGRKSVAVRSYLDRKRFLMRRAHRFPVPPEFTRDSRQLTLF